jgi:hypothetical protein
LLITGGATSLGAATLKLIATLVVFAFPAGSWQRTYRV